jgi:hypothetical protein
LGIKALRPGPNGNENAPVVKFTSPYDDEIIRGETLNIAAEAHSNFGIKQVEFYLDDNLLKIDNDAPYGGTYRLAGDVEDGTHTLKAKAYDQIGNATTRTISIIIGSAGAGNSSSLYLKPLSGSSFPFQLQAAVSSSGVRKVEFYYQLDSVYDADHNLVSKPGASYRIGESANGGGTLYQLAWNEDPEYFIAGRYRVYAVLTTEDGKRYKSNERLVEIN